MYRTSSKETYHFVGRLMLAAGLLSLRLRRRLNGKSAWLIRLHQVPGPNTVFATVFCGPTQPIYRYCSLRVRV